MDGGIADMYCLKIWSSVYDYFPSVMFVFSLLPVFLAN